jgi:carboxyl-terminal processing protease
MKPFFLTCFYLCCLLASCSSKATLQPSPTPNPTVPATGQPGPTPEASDFLAHLPPTEVAYLDEALDTIQKNALNQDKVDWPSLRTMLLEQGKNMKTRTETYDLIRAALFELQDYHSYFLPPEAMSALETGLPVENSLPQVDLVDGKYAEVIMPGFENFNPDQGRMYADGMQQKIRELDQKNPCGWIVDLRMNTGGNMWPMLAGLGPILGDGIFGSFSKPGVETHTWSYQNGKAMFDSEVQIQVSGQPYRISHPDAPLAVLLGHETASSGEAIALSFIGRSNTRSFGSETNGLTTANAIFPMSDGASINLTVAVDADRTGKMYGQEISPDVETGGDGIPKEALQWLADQPACKK